MVKIYELDSPSDDQSLEYVSNLTHEKTKDIQGGTKLIHDIKFPILPEGPPPIEDWIILREGPPPPHDCIIVREGIAPPPPFLEDRYSPPKHGFHPGHVI